MIGLEALRRMEDEQPRYSAPPDSPRERQDRAERYARFVAFVISRHGVVEEVGGVPLCRSGWPAASCEYCVAAARILGYPFPWAAQEPRPRPHPGGVS